MCHNDQGVEVVLNELTQNRHPGKPLVLIFGASIGKNTENIFKVLEKYESIKSIYAV